VALVTFLPASFWAGENTAGTQGEHNESAAKTVRGRTPIKAAPANTTKAF